MNQKTVLTALKHYTDWLAHLVHYFPYIALAIGVVLLLALMLRVALRLWDWRQILCQKYTFLEITPPITANKTPLQSTEWISRMHGIGSSRTRQESIQRLHFSQSLELSSTNQGGIRYVTRVPEQEIDLIKQSVGPHLNNARIRTVKDYLPADLNYKNARVLEFNQAAAYFLPLKTQDSFQAHDPVGHLINAMNGLKGSEQIVLQLIAVPSRFKENYEIQQRLGRNMDMLAHANQHKANPWFRVVVKLPLKAISEIVMFITDVVYSSPNGYTTSNQMAYEHQVRSGMKPTRVITPSEQALNDSILSKVSHPHHFRVEIRALIITDDRKQAKTRVKAMRGAMSAYKTEHQSLRMRWNFPAFIIGRYKLFKFKYRLPSLLFHHSNKLAASEIADIYHFPVPGTYSENVVQSLSRTLPATLSQKDGTGFDVVVGRNVHQEQSTDIGLTAKIRMKHMYLIGSTGTGKTTMLKRMIYQDMVNGKGLAVLDPHGDMFRELLEMVPEHRRKEVVVFDPSDREYPPGLNILDPGVEFASEDDKHEWIASSVVHVFERLSDPKNWGPRMEQNLRIAVLTALKLPSPSLFTIQRLLTEKSFQRKVAKTITDPALKQFWGKEFKLMGTMQLSSATAPITHRLGRFITSKMSRHILLQEKSTIRIADIMNEGKILLVNLSKGDIGEDQSFFFGTLLTSLIWMAAYQRTRIPEKDRKDFYLYVDEFQNFATKQFTDITSEGRKFHIGLIASHQNIAQVEDQNILKIVAGNAHAMVCLKASPDDEDFILPYMKPEVQKGDIVNLAPYHFYMKTTTDESEFAFSGETVPLGVEGSSEVAQEVMANSRNLYAKPLPEVEKYMDQVFGVEEPKKSDDRGKGKNKKKKVEEKPNGNSDGAESDDLDGMT